MLSDPDHPRANKIGLLKDCARRDYPLLWRNMTAEWKSAGPAAVWLMYSANYLFRTAGLRWAMDPFSLSARLPGLDAPDYAAGLAGCSLVVLTHAHADHLDLELLAAISKLPIRWIIPEHTLPAVRARLDLSSSQVIVPRNGEPISIGSVTLTPMNGLHRHGIYGIEATGYLVEFEHQRWLFPGDTRTYDLSLLPTIGRLDGCFAHLWLGRGCAAQETPPLVEEFCTFFMGLNPSKLVVTHLNELGRSELDLWDERHYHMVAKRLMDFFPEGNIRSACMGEKVILEPS